MNVDDEIIKRVLALFDDDDIKYIDFEKLYNNNLLDNEDTKSDINYNVKVKRRVERNDRQRK